nr:ROK family protein [Erysipelothrix anatis]
MGNLQDVKQIAICLPGIVSDTYDVLSKASPRVRSLYDTNVAHEITKRTGLAVFACNDAYAAAMGEFHFGSLKNTSSSFTYIIGTAVGGCFMIGDSIQKGTDNYAANISMMPLSFNEDKPIWTYTRCSASALYHRYHAYSKRPLPSAKAIIEAAEINDDAAHVVDQWIADIAHSLLQVSIHITRNISQLVVVFRITHALCNALSTLILKSCNSISIHHHSVQKLYDFKIHNMHICLVLLIWPIRKKQRQKFDVVFICMRIQRFVMDLRLTLFSLGLLAYL